MTIAELLARLEKATGPDHWGLDREIYCAVFGRTERQWRSMQHKPHYTASIDAALTLVPKGWFWECGYSRHVPHNARVAAQVMSGGFVAECDSNRAIALCIAALRAKSEHT